MAGEEIKPKTIEDVTNMLTYIERKLDLLMQNTSVDGEGINVYEKWKRGGKDSGASEKED